MVRRFNIRQLRLVACAAAVALAVALPATAQSTGIVKGVVLDATGQPVEAEAAYRAAIRLNPEHIDAYTNLGILLNGLKRTEEAAACVAE